MYSKKSLQGFKVKANYCSDLFVSILKCSGKSDTFLEKLTGNGLSNAQPLFMLLQHPYQPCVIMQLTVMESGNS